MKKINFQFKILYALGMIFIIAGHCNDGGISLFYDWFAPYSFHLGLFMFCSGYFYSDTNQIKICNYIAKKIKHLIIPLYLWNFFYAIIISILHTNGFSFGKQVTLYNLLVAPITNGHQFTLNMAGWFIIPLFMTQVFNICFRKILTFIKKDMYEYIPLIIYTILGFTGITLANEGYLNEWQLPIIRFLFLLPFYEFGYFYKIKLEKSDNSSNSKYFFFIFLIDLIMILYLKKRPSYTPSWCNDFTEGVFIPYIAGILGIMFWLRVSRILTPLLQDNKYILLISNNTYIIMINHFLGFFIVKCIYALLFKYTNLASDFDMNLFKTDFWYYYTPNGLKQSLIIYMFAGLVIPILMQWCINKIKISYKRTKAIQKSTL